MPVPRGRRLSGSAAAQCSRCRPSAIAVRSCPSGLRISCWRQRLRSQSASSSRRRCSRPISSLRDPKVLHAIARAWRPSLFAGFMGAFASEFWFLAFAITTAANVRTLALVEVLFAQGVTRFHIQATDHQARRPRHRACGHRCRVTGVGLLVRTVVPPPRGRQHERQTTSQFLSSGNGGSGWNSMPSSESSVASSGVATP